MPKFKLNGEDVEFREGELVIEAAARAGVPIPHYCYHPDLSSPANCRMCLVKMEGAPKLIPSCQWPCNEKMEISTDTPEVEAAQADVMEYLLINHPLDCPICDQAGECKLQQYAYLFGRASSSMEEQKVSLEKRKTRVRLPRWKGETSYGLKGALEALGMKRAFSGTPAPAGADFSGMLAEGSNAEAVYVQAVVHKAFIEVNEVGTEAAAVTMMAFGAKGMPKKFPFVPFFDASRSFVYLIRDVRSGVVLFTGRKVK